MKFYKNSAYLQLFISSSLFFGNISIAFPSLILLGFFVFLLTIASLVVFAVINVNKISKQNYGQISREMVIRASLPSLTIFGVFLLCFIIGGAIALF